MLRKVQLPWTCAASKNDRAGHSRGSGDYSRYKQARDETYTRALNKMRELGLDPLEGPVKVRYDVFPPEEEPKLGQLSPSRADLPHTLCDALLDGLEGGFYEDDAQVDAVEMWLRKPSGRGGIIVQAEGLEEVE